MVSPFLITQAVRARKVKTFLWIIGSTFFIVATVVDYLIYPACNKQDKTGKIYIAVFTPLITVVLNGSSPLLVQRLWRIISHPGKKFVFLVPLCYGFFKWIWIVWKQWLNFDRSHPRHCRGYRKEYYSLGWLHLASIVWKKTTFLGTFSNPARRERLATDIAIMSMLCEASAVISVSGFLHLHEYFYTDGKTVPQLLQSFAITSAVPLVIEWFFTCLSIAIETRYQNRPIMAVWGSQWKIHVTVAIVNTLPIAAWSSLNLLNAIEGRLPTVVDYCEMPFAHL